MHDTLTDRDPIDHPGDILHRIQDGEHFTISIDGTPVAPLAPPSELAIVTLRELAHRRRDVPLPGDGFADALDAVQSAPSRVESV